MSVVCGAVSAEGAVVQLQCVCERECVYLSLSLSLALTHKQTNTITHTHTHTHAPGSSRQCSVTPASKSMQQWDARGGAQRGSMD
eukprot:2954486-Rhodomonas_salina.1